MKVYLFAPVSLRQLGVVFFLTGFSFVRAQTSPAPGAAPDAATNAAASSTLAATPAPVTPVPTIFVCGDSTANSGGRILGWGTPIADYFDKTKAVVNNVAQAGTSSRSYYNGKWQQVVPKMKPGDYLLLVFGINDGLGSLTGKGVTVSSLNGIGDETAEASNGQTVHTYGWYMGQMAKEAQDKNVHVYLLTVTARNIWTNPKAKYDPNNFAVLSMDPDCNPKDDRIERGTADGKYTQWTKDEGAKLHLPVLDLTNLEGDRLEKIGREKVNLLYQDHNHTFPPGADIVARTIISGLKAFKNSPFTALLSEKGQAVETADAKYVTENPASATSTAAKPDEAKPAAAPAATSAK